jgi:hypothetical protein
VAACHYHPDRPGIGICVRCRRVICALCSTQLDGINHCPSCLAALALPRPPAPAARVQTPVAAALRLLFGALALFGLCWLTQGQLAP